MFNLQNKHPKILVIGDLMMDHYIWARCERISPEAPVAVAEVLSESDRLGGACNVANNLIALGAKVAVAGVVGSDHTGARLVEMLEIMGADIQNIVIDPTRVTTKKSRVIAAKAQIVRIDRECKESIALSVESELKTRLEKAIKNADCVVISDYAKGLLTPTLTQFVITTAKEWRKFVLCDPKGSDYSKYKNATLLTPNKKEASIATGIAINDDKSLLEAGLKLKKICALSISLITLSEEGIGIFESAKTHRKIPTLAKEVYDVTGAGDTVIAALAFCLSSGIDIYKAAEFANIAAAVVVGKVGSAVATQDEIARYLASHRVLAENNKIVALDELLRILASLRGDSPSLRGADEVRNEAISNANPPTNRHCEPRAQASGVAIHLSNPSESIIINGKPHAESPNPPAKKPRIVFTNGCFDILHAGHVSYLREARALGDLLIVGLNSDASVKRLKGESRPVNCQIDRALLLSALEFVDFVVIFDADTPANLVEKIRPDVLVKGGDYKNKKVVGSEHAAEVVLIDFVEGKSTSALINKIRS